MSELKEAIKKLASQDAEMYSCVCEVIEVNTNERTVDVQPIDSSAEIYGVRLQSSLDSKVGVVVFPKMGSKVIVTFINELTGYVALAEEIEEIQIKIGQQSFRLDKKGIAQASATNDLAKSMDDLFVHMEGILSLLQTFSVMCASPGSPSPSVAPQSLSKVIQKKAELNVIKTQFKSLLNEY